ncbi:MAG: trigger factor [Bdellovibrionaceae bacterium]|nr:trigger factor [Pseudobdellovibrionaceae bacterium]
MKSTLETLSTLERKLNIVVPAQDVQAAFERAFKGIQQHATIKGFRKGKAPLTAIRQMFGDRVKQDVVQDIVQKHYATALDEHSLNPVSFPAIEFDEIKEGTEFSFSAEFEVRPDVKVAHFEKLPVKKEKFESKPEFVEQTLEDIRKSRAELGPVFEDRAAQMGDVAVIDFKGELLTGPLENGSAEGHPLELGSNSFIPGFEEGIVGMRVGQSKTVNVSFPETYHVQELAGKPVAFQVTLKELKKKNLPELNDEFAKSLGGQYDSLEALKKAIHDDHEKRETRRIQEDLKNRLMKVLVERNPVEVPKSLLTEQKKALVEDFKNRMTQQGMPEDKFEEYRDKWEHDFNDTARFMIQSSFLTDTIAKEYNLYAEAKDIEAKLNEYATQTGIDVARVKEFYGEQDRRSRLAYQVTEEKVIDFLISKADLKEVSRAEIEKEEGNKDA